MEIRNGFYLVSSLTFATSFFYFATACEVLTIIFAARSDYHVPLQGGRDTCYRIWTRRKGGGILLEGRIVLKCIAIRIFIIINL